MFAIALLCASVSGEATDDGVINDEVVAKGAAANEANISSTALFIALLTFAGITVVDGSTTVASFFSPMTLFCSLLQKMSFLKDLQQR